MLEYWSVGVFIKNFWFDFTFKLLFFNDKSHVELTFWYSKRKGGMTLKF